MRICAFHAFMRSCVGHFPRSGNNFERSFLCSVWSPKMTIQKINFLLYFQKVNWVGGGGYFFLQPLFLKEPNTAEYAQDLVVKCPKLKSGTALLPPPPNKPFFFNLTKFIRTKWVSTAFYCRFLYILSLTVFKIFTPYASHCMHECTKKWLTNWNSFIFYICICILLCTPASGANRGLAGCIVLLYYLMIWTYLG